MELLSCDDDHLTHRFDREITFTHTKMTEWTSAFKEGQKKFGEDIGMIVNSLLLTIVYILGVGATYIVAKLVRKSFLEVSQNKKAASYWEDLNLAKKKKEEYYRQF